MSAILPRRYRWYGRNRRSRFAANHRMTLADVVGKLQAASRSDGPKVLAGLLDSVDIPARFAIIKLVTGGLRIGVSARLAKQALADFGGVDVGEIEELWHGLTPPYSRAVRMAGGQGREAAEKGGGAVPPGDAVEPGRAQRSRKALALPTIRPNGNGTASAFRWRASAACGGCIRAPATTSRRPFPISSRRCISTPCSTANCWSAGRPNGPARSPSCSSGSTARASRRRCASSIRCSCAATTCCRTATPIRAPCR